MAAVSAPSPKLDRYIVVHVATTCDEHGVYVTKDSAEVIELGWILLDTKSCEEVCSSDSSSIKRQPLLSVLNLASSAEILSADIPQPYFCISLTVFFLSSYTGKASLSSPSTLRSRRFAVSRYPRRGRPFDYPSQLLSFPRLSFSS